MVIGIDGNEANVEHRVGISEYAYELLLQFYNFQSSISNLQFEIYLKDAPNKSMPKEKEGWHYRIIGPKKLWTQLALPFDLFTHKPRPDLFFSPTHYSPRFSPMPTVVSVMDLSYIYFPQMFKKSDLYQLRNWTEYSIRKAAKVFTISNSSKDDIIKAYKIDPKKVVVTHLGIKMQSKTRNLKTKNSELVRSKYGVNNKYILFVGTLQPRKNIVRLIEAFLAVASEKEDIELVIIGKKGWMYEDIVDTPKKAGIENRVKFLSFVPDEDLVAFYENAECFVLPSLYEGFGLPILEAMKNGCPVITSKISSLPEAGGDAALYIDPEDTSDIAKKIIKVLDDSKLRKSMIEKGLEHVKKFSWEKTATQTLKVLEELVKNER